MVISSVSNGRIVRKPLIDARLGKLKLAFSAIKNGVNGRWLILAHQVICSKPAGP